MTMPKKRLISGTDGLIAQRGEKFFRLLARHLEVERVGAQINPAAPGQFAGRADADLLEGERVAPQGEHTLAHGFGEVHGSAYPVIKFKLQRVSRQRLDPGNPSHGPIPPRLPMVPGKKAVGKEFIRARLTARHQRAAGAGAEPRQSPAGCSARLDRRTDADVVKPLVNCIRNGGVDIQNVEILPDRPEYVGTGLKSFLLQEKRRLTHCSHEPVL